VEFTDNPILSKGEKKWIDKIQQPRVLENIAPNTLQCFKITRPNVPIMLNCPNALHFLKIYPNANRPIIL